MPRSGGPSQGCQACRKARRKCDEKRPSCGRCLVRGLECSGPPDFFQTHLRDETSKYPKALPESSTTVVVGIKDRMLKLHRPVGLLNNGLPSPVNPPSTPPEFRAESFLFNACQAVSYTVPYPGWGPFIRHLPRLLAKSLRDSPLRAATQALALSTTALQPGLAAYATLASKWYGAALRMTNAAIADPEDALSDETLMATLLLSVYECYRPSTGVENRGLYRSHLLGAATLVCHRGLGQFINPGSKELFRAVRAQLTNLFTHRKEALPAFPHFKEWNADPDDDEDELSLLTAVAWKIPGLGADAEALSCLDEPQEIARTAQRLLLQAAEVDTALLHWHEVYLRSWGHFITSSQPAYIETSLWNWPTMDDYPDLHVSSTLNTYRVYRIHAQQVRLLCFGKLQQLPVTTDEEREHQRRESATSTLVLRDLCDGICASVAYHLDPKNDPYGTGEMFVSSALITVSHVDGLPLRQKANVERLLDDIAFSTRERVGPSLVWDARIMTRMGKFTRIPSALKNDTGEELAIVEPL